MSFLKRLGNRLLGFAVKLSVQDNNTSGYPFWQKLGFNAVNKIECEGFFNISMELK